jgi:hypothetical protein
MDHQQKEMHQMQKATARMSALEFREKVLESDYEAQNNVAPFLENKVLRRIIKTFTNDDKGDFAKWARNPLVIQMLARVKEVRVVATTSSQPVLRKGFSYLPRLLVSAKYKYRAVHSLLAFFLLLLVQKPLPADDR